MRSNAALESSRGARGAALSEPRSGAVAGQPAPGSRSGLRPWVAGRLERTSPLLRQLPIAALYLLAVALCVVIPEVPVTNGTILLLGAAVVLVGTGLAFALTLRDVADRFGNVVAALDVLAIVALRYSTGGNRSIFGVLVILPALWLASNAGRRYIGYTVLGVALVFLGPLSLPGALAADPTGIARAAFNVLAYAVAGTIINELSRQARIRLARVQEHERAVEQEIERGREVQQALLPASGSPVPGYEAAGVCISARTVGGDFYDWYSVPEGLGFTLADVMGKGVGAGMIAATTRSVIRSAREDVDRWWRSPEPTSH